MKILYSGLVWTGELWSNSVVLILRKEKDFFCLKKISLKNSRFFEKKLILWVFFEILGFFDNFKFLLFLDFLIFFSSFFFELKKKIIYYYFFFGFHWFFSKLLRLLLKVTKVTIVHQKWPKIAFSALFLTVGARSRPSLAVKPLTLFLNFL